MFDEKKYQSQIIREIYGFDDENKIGKEVRIELLKLFIGEKFQYVSLNEFRKNNGNIKNDYMTIRKDDKYFYINSPYNVNNKIISTDSNDPFVLKLFLRDNNEGRFYQELIMSYDTINPSYTINTKYCDDNTIRKYGYIDYSNLSKEENYGFSWDIEKSTTYPYTSSTKLVNDLCYERNMIYSEIKKDGVLNLKKSC